MLLPSDYDNLWTFEEATGHVMRVLNCCREDAERIVRQFMRECPEEIVRVPLQ